MINLDWNTFDTPAGPRTGGRIPELVRRADDPDPKVRARALQDVHRAVVRVAGGYGTPFSEAGLALLPWLEARLAAGDGRGQVLRILGDLAAGDHRLHLARGLPALDRADIGPAVATQVAIQALASAILTHLGDADPDVRASAAFALAWLPGAADRATPALNSQLAREPQGTAAASMALALGYLAASSPSCPPGVADALARIATAKAPLGLCAALGQLLAEPARLGERLDALLAPPPKPVVKGLPFASGAILVLRTEILGGATVQRGDLEAQQALVTRLGEPLTRTAEAWTVLVAAQSDGRVREGHLDVDGLPEAHRSTLRGLAARLRTDGGHLYPAFWRAGLFQTIDANERALGVDAPGPLDRRVAGRPLWWWLAEARAARLPEAAWLGHLAVLDAADTLAVLEDAATAPFELYRARPGVGGYDVAPLIGLIERAVAARGVGSVLLAERLEILRGYQASGAAPSAVAWP